MFFCCSLRNEGCLCQHSVTLDWSWEEGSAIFILCVCVCVCVCVGGCVCACGRVQALARGGWVHTVFLILISAVLSGL